MTYTYKNIWAIAAPILMGLIIHQLIGTTDTIFLGRVGKIELGAAALGGIFYIVLYMLGHGFSSGVQIMIAQRNGEKNFSQIGSIFYQSLSFLSLVAAVLILFTQLWARPILSLFISSPNVLEATLDYVYPRVWGLFFAFAIVNFRAFFVGITITKVLFLNAIMMLLTNIVLDYILIFGKFGAPKLGIAGSAYASVAAEAVSVFFFAFYLFAKTNWKNFCLQKFVWRNISLLREIFNLSFWTTIQAVIALGTWMFFMIAIENLGERELAASNILRNISSLVFMVISALASTANTITGNLVGQRKDSEIMASVGKTIKLAYLIGFPLVVILTIFYKLVFAIYTDDKSLTTGLFPAYLTMHSSFFTLVPGMVWLSTISGLGKTKLGMNIELVCLGIYVAAVWFVVSYLKADLAWCWLCEQYYNIPLIGICWWYLKKQRNLFQA